MSPLPNARAGIACRMASALLIVAGVFSLPACSGSRTEGLDTSKLPEDVRADYGVFARRCSKCHSLARPLTTGITDDDQWVMYVNRMRRQPGSGISYEDQDRILRFLRYYAADLRQKEAEKKAPPPPAPPPASASTAPPASVPPGPAPPGDAAAPAATTTTTGDVR